MSQVFELDAAWTDLLSKVGFSPTGDRLFATSWERSVTIFRKNEALTPPYTFERRIRCRAPVLDACWGADDSTLYIVGGDHDVRRLDLTIEDDKECQTILSTHRGRPSSKIVYSKAHNLLISTSWASTLHVHNLAKAEGRSYITIALKMKPTALTLSGERLIVSMLERNMWIYDLQALRTLCEQTHSTTTPDTAIADPMHVQPWQERESSLRWQTRALAAFADGQGFVSGSIEGRVSVDWFAPEEQSKTYAFKCHRQLITVTEDETEKDINMVYPVMAIVFNPLHTDTFVTAGGDGVVAAWDASMKRRIRTYPKLPASVASVDFSPDGFMLAIATSQGLDTGKEQDPADTTLVKVFIRTFTENELKATRNTLPAAKRCRLEASAEQREDLLPAAKRRKEDAPAEQAEDLPTV